MSQYGANHFLDRRQWSLIVQLIVLTFRIQSFLNMIEDHKIKVIKIISILADLYFHPQWFS